MKSKGKAINCSLLLLSAKRGKRGIRYTGVNKGYWPAKILFRRTVLKPICGTFSGRWSRPTRPTWSSCKYSLHLYLLEPSEIPSVNFNQKKKSSVKRSGVRPNSLVGKSMDSHWNPRVFRGIVHPFFQLIWFSKTFRTTRFKRRLITPMCYMFAIIA